MRTTQGWLRQFVRQGIAAVLLLVVATMSASAATLTQTFKTTDDISKGNIVSLDSASSTVKRADSSSLNNLYGVSVGAGDVNFVRNSSDGAQIASTGVLDTLVSTLNGPIKNGDAISVSIVQGVGEKAITKGKIIGIAQEDFNDKTKDAKDFTLTNNGVQKNIKVGLIPVKIEVSNYNPATGLVNGEIKDVSDRNKAEQLADSIAGKPVRAITLVAAGLILMVSIFSSIFLVLSSSYASMLSVGRNPLSQKAIVRSLLRMVVISLLIFGSGVALAYGILRLFA